MTQTVTALYDTYDSAVAAVNALEASGFPHSEISIVSNNVDNRYAKDRPTNAGADAGAGAGIGAVVGGVGGLLTGLGLMAIPGVGPVVAAGWLIATAAGAATGAVVGGAAGGLVGSRSRGQTYPNATPTFMLKAYDAAAPSSQRESMTLAHRQPGKSCSATSRWTRPLAGRHTGKAAGLPSTTMRRFTLPSKSRQSARAMSEAAAFSCFELTDEPQAEVPPRLPTESTFVASRLNGMRAKLGVPITFLPLAL
jgi:hypothetical protein